MANKDTLQTIEAKRIRSHITVITVILSVLSIFLLLRYGLNTAYIKEIENKNFDSKIVDWMIPNIPQSYIPHYNKGNAAYEKGDYTTAIGEYQKALGLFPSHPDECNIRINLALSILQKVDFDDLDDEAKKQHAVEQLLIARNVLTEENCANPKDDSGHNETAEELKRDIDKMLEELAQGQSAENQGDDQGNESDSKDNNSGSSLSQHEQHLQQQLQNQMQDALSTQNEAQQEYQSYGNEGGSTYQYDGKNW